MTKIQSYQQAEGPHRPSPAYLTYLLSKVPKHHEVRAISINGQTGVIVIETYHECQQVSFEFKSEWQEFEKESK